MAIFSEIEIMQCCSCRSFAHQLVAACLLVPNITLDIVIDLARRVWWQDTCISGWLEAFAAHPRIGDVEGLKQKYGIFAEMSRTEQSVAAAGTEDGVCEELAVWNHTYEEKFGHIFIICASGKGAAEILTAVKSRAQSEPYTELRRAAAEQMKITELRLAKLFSAAQPAAGAPASENPASAAGTAAAAVERRAGRIHAHLTQAMNVCPAAATALDLRSPITTHMLDTSVGSPAAGVHISLQRLQPHSADEWERIASGITNVDGRIGNLLPPADSIMAGHYRMDFDTARYMARCHGEHPGFFSPTPFYPRVHVHFQIAPGQERQHFHIPLTWNPFGYSTYRGS